jgi:hypothetical protein
MPTFRHGKGTVVLADEFDVTTYLSSVSTLTLLKFQRQPLLVQATEVTLQVIQMVLFHLKVYLMEPQTQ